jgi:hypothetical protein
MDGVRIGVLNGGEPAVSATEGRENSKSEYRNPKQSQITKEENPKQESALVLDLGDSDFGIVSNFDIRILDLDIGIVRQIKGVMRHVTRSRSHGIGPPRWSSKSAGHAHGLGRHDSDMRRR